MIEMALEEDLPAEFRGGTLRINTNTETKNLDQQSKSASFADKTDKNGSVDSCHWRNAFIAPLSSIPNKISETIWSSKSKEETSSPPPVAASATTVNEKTLQLSSNIKNDPNNFFTFREGVVDRAVKECVAQFLDAETEGPVHAYFLLTQINHWDTDKERLVMLTAKHIVLVKYDFIALRRLGCRKIAYDEIEGIVIGSLVYPNGSLIPDRNMKGIRLLLRQDKSENFASKWNPFNEDVPFLTFTFHPLYFHKDCTEEKQRNLYSLDLFIEHICLIVSKCKENSVILQHNILLENYVGVGSVIHNRNSLGFFKVRGKFSF